LVYFVMIRHTTIESCPGMLCVFIAPLQQQNNTVVKTVKSPNKMKMKVTVSSTMSSMSSRHALIFSITLIADLHRSDHAGQRCSPWPCLLYSLDLGVVAHDGGGKPRIIGRSCSRRRELFKDSHPHLQVL
jgi:hypothetical protein